MWHRIIVHSKRLQKQLFRNIYKLFPYVLYSIKYLLVICHSKGYPLSLIVLFKQKKMYGCKIYSFFFVFLFFVVLQIFDLECHGQTSVKVKLVMFGFVFMKFRKLKSLCWENKKLDLHKTLIFSPFTSFPTLLASSIGQKLFSKNWCAYKLNLVP